MDPRTVRRVKLVCAWCGPATLVITAIGFFVAGLLPVPLSPDAGTNEVVAFYAEHAHRTAGGFVIASLGLPLVLPLIGLITFELLRIEGRHPVLAFVQAAAGAATAVLLLIPILMMAALSFRPERDPGLTVTLDDYAWLLFLTPIGPFMIQNISIGVAVLGDRSADPVLPRWLGYVNLLVAFTFVPDVLAFVFRTGPFAWNGVFVFWLAFTSYAAFLVVMGIGLRARVLADDAEQVVVAEPEPAVA